MAFALQNMSRSALAAGMNRYQAQAARAGTLVTQGIERGISTSISYGMGVADGKGLSDPGSSATQVAVLAAGVTAQVFAPGKMVAVAGRAAVASALDVIGYKAGLRKGLEFAAS